MSKKNSLFKIAALALGITLVATACDFGNSKTSAGNSQSDSTSTPVTASSTNNSSASNNSNSSVSSKAPISSSIIPTLTGITLNTNNVKKDYNYGDKLTLAGLVVTASYSNNTTKQVTSGYTSNPANDSVLNTVGENTVTITYESFTASFKITVNKLLTGIELNTENVKKEYGYNEALDLTGLVVTAKYNDNSSVAVEDYTTNPAKGTLLTNAGENTVTVTYQEKTATFKINVIKVLTGIDIDINNVKTEYYYNDELDLSGLVVKAKYDDNSVETVTDYTTDPVDGAVLKTLGENTVTVTYGTFTKEFKITVERKLTGIEVEAKGAQKVFYQGEEYHPWGLCVDAFYNDGFVTGIGDYTTDPAIGTILDTVGKVTVTVSYHGFKDTYEITVEPALVPETGNKLVLDLSNKLDFSIAGLTAYANARGTTPNSDYFQCFYFYKNSNAQGSMTTVNSKLRVMAGDVIRNADSLHGVTAITVNGGNGNFRLFAGYTEDKMYEFLESESNGGDRTYTNVPNVNYIKLVGKYDNYPADISSIEFTYTRNANYEVVDGQETPINTLTVNEGEYLKGSKTLVVSANTVSVDEKTYTYTGIFYEGALLYANEQGAGLLVKYVNNTAVIVRDTLDNYSSLSGEYTKVIPATKVEMFVNGVKTAANTADSRVEMKAGESFTFSATCDAAPAEEPTITLVDESNPGEVDPYVGSYAPKSTVTVTDIMGVIGEFELTVKPIQIIKQEGEYYAVYEDVATGPYEGTKDVFTATVSSTAITFGDSNLSVKIDLEDKQIEFTYVNDDYGVYCQGEIGYKFTSSVNRTAEYVNGKAVALAAGDFYMSAKASNGVESRYYVRVKAYIPATLTVETTAEVEVGKTYQINASVNADATDKTILFESADKTIATVDENGLVTGVKAGKTTITVISNDDEKTVAITVKAGAATVVTTTYSFTDENGDNHTFVFVEGTKLTIDGTYTFTYSNGTYVYDENNEIMVELRISGNNGYLTVLDENMVIFGYMGGPIYVIDLDNELMLDFVSKTEETQGQGGQGGGQEAPQITGTYEFVDDYSVTHTIVITKDDATIDDTWVFNNENGNYVFQYDSDCYLTFTRDANGITMHFEDYSQSMASYGAAYLDNTTGDIELNIA